MKITVLGASGRVGRLVVAELLKRGHQVTAFCHSKTPFEDTAGLTVVTGDIHEPNDLKKATSGSEAVVSALGSWGTKQKDILSFAFTNLVPILKESSIKRVVSLTGSGAHTASEKQKPGFSLSDWIQKPLLGKILKDGEKHIALLEASKLPFTIVRSPVMTDKGSKNYELTLKSPGGLATINRSAVAIAMADLVEGEQFIGESPFIVRA